MAEGIEKTDFIAKFWNQYLKVVKLNENINSVQIKELKLTFYAGFGASASQSIWLMNQFSKDDSKIALETMINEVEALWDAETENPIT